MTSAISIMIVILLLGIGVDALFNLANGRIRRRWGLADPASAS
jgi:NitT/TauT family transport system permease protein